MEAGYPIMSFSALLDKLSKLEKNIGAKYVCVEVVGSERILGFEEFKAVRNMEQHYGEITYKFFSSFERTEQRPYEPKWKYVERMDAKFSFILYPQWNYIDTGYTWSPQEIATVIKDIYNTLQVFFSYPEKLKITIITMAAVELGKDKELFYASGTITDFCYDLGKEINNLIDAYIHVADAECGEVRSVEGITHYVCDVVIDIRYEKEKKK